MGLVGLSVFILGLITHFAIAQPATTMQVNATEEKFNMTYTTIYNNGNETETYSTTEPTLPYTNETADRSGNHSTTTTSTTNENGTRATPSPTISEPTKNSELPPTKPKPATVKPVKPVNPVKPVKPVKPVTLKPPSSTAKPQKKKKKISTAVLVTLLLVFLSLLGMGAAYCFLSRRSRRYMVDQHSRPDEAEVPLSAMDERSPETASQNGMQTFSDRVGGDSEHPPTQKETKDSEPEEKPGGQEEQKAETEVKPAADTSTDPPASALSPDSDSVDKPVPEETPAPAEENPGDKSDDEGATSNQTSQESLKELNGNNSNNVIQTETPGDVFSEVPLDSPV